MSGCHPDTTAFSLGSVGYCITGHLTRQSFKSHQSHLRSSTNLLRDLNKPSRQTARALRGLSSFVSTIVDTGIIDRRSTTWTRQNAKRRLNLQRHRKQEMRSASGKYPWEIYKRGSPSYSLTTGAVVTNLEQQPLVPKYPCHLSNAADPINRR